MIVGASSQIIRRAPPSSLTTSYEEAPEFIEHVIVTLEDESGVIGLGEATPVPAFTGETATSVDFQLRTHILSVLHSRSAFNLNEIHRELDRLPGNPAAKAAIDIALYDLQGKLSGRPVVDLLGGELRNSVELSFPIGICSIAEAVSLAESASERGIGTLKLKIGHNPDDDFERLQAVRFAVGPNIKLRADANGAYCATEAVRIVERLAAVDLECIEQPVQQWDFAGMADVRRATGVPVMVDESLNTLRDAALLIALGAADMFAIKLISTGGLRRALPIIQLAAEHRIGVVISSPSDTQIGAAAVLALALEAPTGDRAHELRAFDSQPEMAVTDIRVERGAVYPDITPGLGVSSIIEIGGQP